MLQTRTTQQTEYPKPGDRSLFLSARAELVRASETSTTSRQIRPNIVPSRRPREAVTRTIQPALHHSRRPERRRPIHSGTSEGPNLTNPTLGDPIERWQDYYRVHKASWPRGVRADSTGGPLKSDLRADRAIAQMCPGPEYVPVVIEDSVLRPRASVLPEGEGDEGPRP